MNAEHKTLSDLLKSAQPRLLSRVEPIGATSYNVTPYISEAEVGWDELLDEGYDPNHSPLGPVYWRIIRRGDQKFYCSTARLTRDQVIKTWGVEGAAFCDPITGLAVARVETLLLSTRNQHNRRAANEK